MFVEISKYVVVLMVDKADKCKRFGYGLREEIKLVVTATGYENFGKLVESALRVEKCLSKRQSG